MLNESDVQEQIDAARIEGQEEKQKIWPKVQSELKNAEQNLRPTIKECSEELKKLEQKVRPDVKKAEEKLKKLFKKRF